jgi:hypothetical protein
MGLRLCLARGAFGISAPHAVPWSAAAGIAGPAIARWTTVALLYGKRQHLFRIASMLRFTMEPCPARSFCRLFSKRNEPFQVLATLMGWTLSFLVNRPVRDPMISIIPIEVVWLSTGFIMLMAAFLAGAAE